MNKLVVVIIGQDCEDTIGMCLESVKDADKIIYVDGGSADNTLNIAGSKIVIGQGDEILHNNFDKSNPNMISIQRNFYLDYLKKNHLWDWCLVLDSDEVLDTHVINNIKAYITGNNGLVTDVVCPRMRHLMYTLGWEDASKDKHYVPNRLFKIDMDLFYPEGEHTILSSKKEFKFQCKDDILIWHLGYLGSCWDVKKRYDQQKLRNNGHNLEYLNQWNKTHMLGKYPIRAICTDDLPDVILKNFGLSEEQVYFENRMNVENKHFVFVKQWNEFFKPKTVADFGCGTGLYLYAWEMTRAECLGFEYSKYAREHRKCSSVIIDIDLNKKQDALFEFDLVTALDVLEHLNYETIDEAIETLIKKSNKYILTSIPYKGTPNCEMDKTHIIKESEDWWRQKFLDKGLKEVEVPEHFIFKEQLLIFEK